MCSLFFCDYLVHLIPHFTHNKWYQSRQFVVGVDSIVHVYGTIYVHNIIHIYGIVLEYGGANRLYLGGLIACDVGS